MTSLWFSAIDICERSCKALITFGTLFIVAFKVIRVLKNLRRKAKKLTNDEHVDNQQIGPAKVRTREDT